MHRTLIGIFRDPATTSRAEEALTNANFEHERLVADVPTPDHALAGEGVHVIQEAEREPLENAWVEELTAHGVPEDRARGLAASVPLYGAAVAITNLDDDRAEEAAAILSELRPTNPSDRLEVGNSGYNAVANPFDDEAAQNRTRFADEHPGSDVAVVLVM